MILRKIEEGGRHRKPRRPDIFLQSLLRRGSLEVKDELLLCRVRTHTVAENRVDLSTAPLDQATFDHIQGCRITFGNSEGKQGESISFPPIPPSFPFAVWSPLSLFLFLPFFSWLPAWTIYSKGGEWAGTGWVSWT